MIVDLRKQNFKCFIFPQYNKGQEYIIELYDDGIPYNVDVSNYSVTMEISSPTCKAYYKTKGITTSNNKIIFLLDDGITQNHGKGKFNIVITKKDSSVRIATFSIDFYVKPNSFDANTVPAQVASDFMENIAKGITDASHEVIELENKIEEIKDTGEITEAITKMDSILNLSDSNFKKSLLDMFYPVKTIYMTENPSFNPNNVWGGKWELIAQGRNIVGVGKGTDSNGNNKDFVLGNNDGEYKHTLLKDELAKHKHEITVSGTQLNWAKTFYKAGTETGGMRIINKDDSNAIEVLKEEVGNNVPFNLCSPSYGAYIWLRTL